MDHSDRIDTRKLMNEGAAVRLTTRFGDQDPNRTLYSDILYALQDRGSVDRVDLVATVHKVIGRTQYCPAELRPQNDWEKKHGKAPKILKAGHQPAAEVMTTVYKQFWPGENVPAAAYDGLGYAARSGYRGMVRSGAAQSQGAALQ